MMNEENENVNEAESEHTLDEIYDLVEQILEKITVNL